MHPSSSFADLKAAARAGLNGHYRTAILAFFYTSILCMLPPYIALILFPGNTLFSLIASQIASLILGSIFGILQAGLLLVFLKLSRRQQASVLDLFWGFRNSRNAALEISLVFTLLEYVCQLPVTVLSYTPFFSAGTVSANLCLLLLGVGTRLAAFLFSLPLIQSYFLLLDHPQYTGKEAMKESIRLMKGHCLSYALLLFSFLPIILLSMLSLGIGLLWVMPYMVSTRASFYVDLTRKDGVCQDEKAEGEEGLL